MITLCPLEKVFPPCFSHLMMHLVVYLVDELDLCRHVHSCLMYPIEHVMKDLKGSVKNMCKPKDYMAERYIFDEALGLCIEYMQNFEATRRRIWDVNEDGVGEEVLDQSMPKPRHLTLQLWDVAHLYVCETLVVWCE